MTKRIVLCADDYGQALNISEGIIDLVKQSRLSAVSCLTNFPEWQRQADLLKPYREQIDIGLHFNLTEGRPLSPEFRERYGDSFPTLLILIVKSMLNLLDKPALEAEMRAQINQFQKAMGFLPDFLDGHQHVHQLPVVRDALLAVYPSLMPKLSYIRLVASRLSSQNSFKKVALYGLGGRQFGRLLIQNKIPFNQSFAGFYDFKSDYPKVFENFLNEIEDRGIIMCHPGRPADNSDDSINLSRPHERNYFLSDDFLAACKKHSIELGRFK